jgi:hypothetical protein
VTGRTGLSYRKRGRRGRDRMVVGFTTTHAVSAYHRFTVMSYGGLVYYLISK